MRYAESQAKKPIDISPRRRFPTLIQFSGAFLLLYLLLIGYFAISSEFMGFAIWAVIVIGGLSVFVMYTVHYNRDLLLATEFQNAVFANALATNYLFSIIARRDGSIIFADTGMKTHFPEYSRLRHTSLQDFFALADVSEEHSQAVVESLNSDQRESILFSARMVMDEGKDVASGAIRKDLVFTIDPIARPGNFLLLRARSYSDRRAVRSATSLMAETKMNVVEFEALSKLKGLFHALPLGVLYVDAHGVLQFVNHTVEKWLGYHQGYFAEQQDVSIADVLRDHEAVLLSDSPEQEVYLRHATGQFVSYRMKANVQRVDSNVSSVSAVFYEAEPYVSKKVHVPEPATVSHVPAAETSRVPVAPAVTGETVMADMFADAPLAIVKCDSQGEIKYANQTFDALVKCAASDRPANLLDFVAQGEREAVSKAIGLLCAGKAEKPHVDITFILPNNETVAVSVFAGKEDSQGLTFFYLVDITEQKNLESRFAHSQKMQAVGQLAGGVAHDFNNLLTAMIGFCDLLLIRHPAGDQSFADLMQIKQNANRAANLVRQLLAFSRKQTLQAKNIDITEVLAELSNLIRRLIGENIELKMIHGRDLNMIKADQGQLEQVIINLAVNARDAMMDGGLLTIRSSNVTIDASHPLPRQLSAPAGEDGSIPAGDYVLIEMSDNGTGIPEDILSKIFEPFFSTKEIGSGTGLGLATVYGIIKQTGGYILVGSALGEGTQFHIYFPALSANEVRTAEVEVQEQHAQDLTGRETILLVEDETPVRAFASRALKNKGYTVFEADCAENALELVRDHGSKLDLIVTDVIMPGMNGPTMVEKISVEFPDIKVVFMSGYAEDIFMNNYGSERSFNFLSKPFTLKQLASKVKEILSA